MEYSGWERLGDHAAGAPDSPRPLLELLLPRLAEPAALLDESLTVVAANDAFGALAGTDRTVLGERVTDVAPALTEDAVDDVLGSTDEYVTVRTGETPDRWTEFGFDRHGSHVLCVGRDVNPDRPAVAVGNRGDIRERFAAVQRVTRELRSAETKAAVARHVVETATTALALSGATLYLFDAQRNVLWPAGRAGAAGADGRRTVGCEGDGEVCAAFLDGCERTLDGGDRYRPLGDHGVFHTVADERDERTRELVKFLAESAETALDRVERAARSRKRAATCREQARRVTELERVVSVQRRVNGALVDADSVTAVERGVCEALAESEWVSFAWLGRVDSDSVDPRAWAGRGSDYLEAVSLSTVDGGGPPAVRTAWSDTPTTVGAIADDISERQWRAAALGRDFQAAISVPLRSDGVGYGVLSVYADRPLEFESPLASVVAELGDSVANAMREQELRSRYTGDSTVELGLTVEAPDAPLCRLAAELGAPVDGTTAFAVDGTATRLVVRATGVAAGAVDDAASAVQHVDSVEPIADGDRYELLVSEPTVVGRLLRNGGRLRDTHVEAGAVAVTVAVASETDVRTFVDRLADRYDRVELTARREAATATSRRDGLRESLEAALTDRQLEVLKTAYSNGFFEWPRATTGEGVAELLEVSQPTVNRHLRVSQRKLLELVFDADDG